MEILSDITWQNSWTKILIQTNELTSCTVNLNTLDMHAELQ